MKLAMLTSSIDSKEREEGFIVDWVEALASQVDRLVVFTLKPQKTALRAKNVKVISLFGKKSKPKKLIYLFQEFAKEHKIEPFDGIFSHMYDFLGVCSGLLGKTFKINSVFWYAWGLGLKRFSLAELSLSLNDSIITCSEETKHRYRNAYGLHQPIYVFGHAINIQRFSNLKESKRKVFTIGFIGRAIPEKNIEVLIKAASGADVSQPIMLSLVLTRLNDNHNYAKKLRLLMKKLKRKNFQIRLLTDLHYEKIPAYLKSLHLYVHPTLVYSIDKSPIEAICSGTPVLLSKLGYRQLLSDYPKILFDPKNIDELKTKLEDAINNYQIFVKYQKPLAQYVRQEFSAEVFMKRLVKLFIQQAKS